jgi:hypothetical protein
MRVLRPAAAVIAAAVVVALALAWGAVATWAQHQFGFASGDGNGAHYLFWSGAGSDLAYLGAGGGAITSAVVLYRHHNCHEPRCARIGRVRVDDHGTLSCFRHHPDGTPRRGHVARAHRAHQERSG